MSIVKKIETKFEVLKNGMIQVNDTICIMENDKCISRANAPYVLNPESGDYGEGIIILGEKLSTEQKETIALLADIE